MSISYNNLWKNMIDLGINKKQLAEMTGISPTTITNMAKNQFVHLETIYRISIELDLNIEDIVTFNYN
ncbi:helix-turn-helix domain-containing protein [Falseniella ignava]|uniref:HTH cro/C1-type domain-containing protein n=1 Tax=Falseniella ignava CCUG 37419 TaxID=883112 RepID=K1M0G5_9LACT|nr:helix-turn-helix transcriptional regulator [Falseniella ignava]EKB55803.1 hypothetical protein HMPREF9707_00990 [Falseniella ignava CCUG 37419]